MAASTTAYLISIPFLTVFALGIYRRVSLWLEGSLDGERGLTKGKKSARIARLTASAFLSRKVLFIVETIGLDYIAGRRAFRESRLRWAMHSLILWGFIGLMIFDAVEVSHIRHGMGEEAVKDLPHMALAFDLFGAMMIAGVVIAALRRVVLKVPQLQNTPEDTAAVVLLAVMVISGFLLEGARYLMLETPAEVARYAFIGHLISLAGTPGTHWEAAHRVFWYLHALASFTFIAYIPFGKFIHLFASPLVIAANSLSARREA